MSEIKKIQLDKELLQHEIESLCKRFREKYPDIHLTGKITEEEVRIDDKSSSIWYSITDLTIYI